MENFESELARATALDTREILGAITTVVDREGNTLYHRASGYQSLAHDAPPIDHESTFVVGSAGKFITNIAALQCVEHGLITLDEPVHVYLSELENLDIVTRNEDLDDSSQPFILRPNLKPITLRHLLSYASGIDNEADSLIEEWREWAGEGAREAYHPSLAVDPQPDAYSTPLIFEPGEGWMYGPSIEWTAALISRLTNQSMVQYIDEHIFKPLGMKSSTYRPQNHPDHCSRTLSMVRRDGQRLLPVKYPLRELICSVPDVAALLTDLISPSSKLLKGEYVDLLFAPQFANPSGALSAIRSDTENYAAPAGVPKTMTEAPVNHSLAALVVEEVLPLSHMPAGTVTWNGMPNYIWAMHREKGIAMIFATQLLPVDDEKTVDLAMSFMRAAWDTFG